MAEAGIGFVDIVPRTDKFGSQLSGQIQPQLASAGQAASTAFAALGVTAVAAITKGISATQEWAGDVRELQRVTGQSAEDASRLATAGNELGLSTDQLSRGFGLLAKNIVNGSANLEKYGIATTDASGATLPFNDILGAISDKFNSLPPGIEQAAFAQNVFGRSGRDLIPILQQGSERLAELEGHADEYGTTLTDKDLEAVRQLNLAQRQLGEAFKGAAIAIGTDFIPILTEVTDGVTGIVKVFHLIPAPVRTAVIGFTALAGGAAALGKVAGFVVDGWSNLGQVFDQVSNVTKIATGALDENTVAAGLNADAQVSLESAASNIGSTVQAAADIVNVDTDAVEANTVATGTNTTATIANTAAAEASVGAQTAAAVAAGKWATQLGQLNQIANQGGFFANLIQSATQFLNVFEVAAGKGALIFGAIQGFRELSAVMKGDVAGAFDIAADSAGHFLTVGGGIPNILGAIGDQLNSDRPDIEAFQIGVNSLGEQFAAQSISALQLQTGIEELADKYHVGIPDVEAFTAAIEEQHPRATEAADGFDVLGGAVDSVGKTIVHAGHEVVHASRQMYHELRQVRNGLRDTFQVGDDVFSNLGDKAHLSANQIIRAFNRQIRTQKEYQANLETLEKRNTPQALLDQLAALGLDGANRVAALADANDEQFDKIVHKWRETQSGGKDIANTFTGLGNTLRSIPNEVPINFRVTVNGQPVSGGFGQGLLNGTVSPRQITGEAGGGIIAGASGFVTQSPTFLVGEGGTPTFAGRGAEGVIPFNDRGIGILGEALHRAIGRHGGVNVHITVGFDDSGQLHVRRIAQDEIEREHAFRQRVG